MKRSKPQLNIRRGKKAGGLRAAFQLLSGPQEIRNDVQGNAGWNFPPNWNDLEPAMDVRKEGVLAAIAGQLSERRRFQLRRPGNRIHSRPLAPHPTLIKWMELIRTRHYHLP